MDIVVSSANIPDNDIDVQLHPVCADLDLAPVRDLAPERNLARDLVAARDPRVSSAALGDWPSTNCVVLPSCRYRKEPRVVDDSVQYIELYTNDFSNLKTKLSNIF